MTHPNDWKISHFQVLVLGSLAIYAVLIPASELGIAIFYLRQTLGFIILMLAPGYTLLRLFRIHNIDGTKSIVYSIGLSILFTYLVGLFANIALPLFGVKNPISFVTVLISWAILYLLLNLIASIHDRDFLPKKSEPLHSKLLTNSNLVLLLIPLLSILGTLLIKSYYENRLLILVIFIIAIVAILVVINKMPGISLPLAVFAITISLVMQWMLLSDQLIGFDNHREQYFQYLVVENGYWDPSIPDNYNTCLSVTLLGPIFSLLLGVDPVVLFKILNPLINGIIVVTLYCAYKTQIGDKGAFLASLFIVSIYGFLNTATYIRQPVAELFLVLLIFLIVDTEDISKLQRQILAVLFIVGIPLSHYTMASISLGLFLLCMLIIAILKNNKINNYWQKLAMNFDGATNNNNVTGPFMMTTNFVVLSGIIFSLFSIITISWFIYTSGGLTFSSLIRVGDTLYTSLTETIGATSYETLVGKALGQGFFEARLIHQLYRFLQYMTQLFIVLGIIRMFIKPQMFRLEYLCLASASFLILVLCVIVPYLTPLISMERLYRMVTLILAPMCVLGGIFAWDITTKLFRAGIEAIKKPLYQGYVAKTEKAVSGKSGQKGLIFVMAILVPYFMMSTELLYVLFNISPSVTFGPYRMDRYSIFNKQEIYASQFIYSNVTAGSIIDADAMGARLLWQKRLGTVYMLPVSGDVTDNTFIFLRSWNIKYNELEMLVVSKSGNTVVEHGYIPVNLMNRPYLRDIISSKISVYNNGGAMLFAPGK